MPLNIDQQRIVDAATSTTKHIRIRGRAGTGKTHTFKSLIQELRRQGKRTLTVTPTGAAACRITDETMSVFAQTIHRAMGFEAPVRIADRTYPGLSEFMYQCAMSNRRTLAKIQNLDTLLIDECSMVGGQMFQTLDRIFRDARGNMSPFGGVQVILCGDFLQLAPVEDHWLFENSVFKEMNPEMHTLTTIMRTSDPEYTDFQNYIRQRGVPVFGHTAARKARVGNVTEIPDDALLLVHTNREVDSRNRYMAQKLFPGVEMRTFPCVDQDGKRMDVQLCIGMKVMALANHPQLAYANSDIGHITGWDIDDTGDDVAIVQFENGNEEPVRWKRQQWEDENGEMRSRSWYPLKPAYAATINKIQGITADNIAVQCWNTGSHGRLFVALTRCRKLDGLKIILPGSAAMAYDTSVSDSEF